MLQVLPGFGQEQILVTINLTGAELRLSETLAMQVMTVYQL